MENILLLGDMKKFKFETMANSNIKLTSPKEKISSPKEDLD